MRTYSRQTVYPFNPNPSDFTIDVVAHALSLKCRFNGQCREFYSVAQHSVIVSNACSPENQLWGLFHELDEVFLPDIPTPIKHHIKEWKELSKKHLNAGADAFGLHRLMPDEVKEMDLRALSTEREDIMVDFTNLWGDLPKRFDFTIKPLSWQESEKLFLDKYKEIMRKL